MVRAGSPRHFRRPARVLAARAVPSLAVREAASARRRGRSCWPRARSGLGVAAMRTRNRRIHRSADRRRDPPRRRRTAKAGDAARSWPARWLGSARPDCGTAGGCSTPASRPMASGSLSVGMDDTRASGTERPGSNCSSCRRDKGRFRPRAFAPGGRCVVARRVTARMRPRTCGGSTPPRARSRPQVLDAGTIRKGRDPRCGSAGTGRGSPSAPPADANSSSSTRSPPSRSGP